jgi:hypothetical protein
VAPVIGPYFLVENTIVPSVLNPRTYNFALVTQVGIISPVVYLEPGNTLTSCLILNLLS